MPDWAHPAFQTCSTYGRRSLCVSMQVTCVPEPLGQQHNVHPVGTPVGTPVGE